MAEAGLSAAFAALDAAGIEFAFRKGSARGHEPPPGGEVDIALERSHLPSADAALTGAGFNVYSAPGHGAHRFYLAFSSGRWLKIDARLEGGPPRSVRRVAARRPAGSRRLGPVVAVVGPDGAGKGTVIARLAEEIPVETKVLYLGWRKKDGVRRAKERNARPGPLLEAAFVVKGWLRAVLILLGGYGSAWRGAIVLCDRHPVEGLAVRPRQSALGHRLESFLLSRLTPWPDAVVVLDAPTEVLVARKPEHPRGVIERWRGAYAETFGRRGGVLVSSAGALDATVARASAVVWDALRRRRRWNQPRASL
jgi:thymidylate kinase